MARPAPAKAGLARPLAFLLRVVARPDGARTPRGPRRAKANPLGDLPRVVRAVSPRGIDPTPGAVVALTPKARARDRAISRAPKRDHECVVRPKAPMIRPARRVFSVEPATVSRRQRGADAAAPSLIPGDTAYEKALSTEPADVRGTPSATPPR